jgi:hypothetical protein
MLFPWYLHRMHWSGAADFAASDVGSPYPLDRVDVPDSAMFVSGHPHLRDFLLARAGVFRTACPEDVRDRLGASLWYLTLTPVGGNAPAYVLLVHTRSGYLVLSSDV